MGESIIFKKVKARKCLTQKGGVFSFRFPYNLNPTPPLHVDKTVDTSMLVQTRASLLFARPASVLMSQQLCKRQKNRWLNSSSRNILQSFFS